MNRRNVLTVLVETPTHPRAAAIMDKYEPDYREKLDAFTRERGAVYIDFNEEVGFVASDFSDLHHVLKAEARRRYTRSLMKHIAALLRERR